MPTLSITKTYQDGDILLEADLDNIRNDITDFINTTKLDSDNIQSGGVGASNIGINDSEYLEFGTGNDGRIGVVSDDLIIENVTSDKDIIFKINDGGVSTEVARFDGSESTLVMNSKEITGLATPTTASSAATKTYVDQAAPVGIIQAYSAATAPTGWLLCDGSAISRTTYATLFALIGVTAGEGDGSTTFNVPDFRGYFLRGRDASAANDPDAGSRTAMATGGATGDAIFSIQADDVGAHDHDSNKGSEITNALGNGYARSVTSVTDGNLIEDTGTGIGNETRPINAYVNYIIKYA